MTPLMCSAAPSVVKSSSRSARRFSSLGSTPAASRRLSMVPLLSSAARIPLPSATSAAAVSLSSSDTSSPLHVRPLVFFAFPLAKTPNVEPATRSGRRRQRCATPESAWRRMAAMSSRVKPGLGSDRLPTQEREIKMPARIVVTEFVSLDGVMEAPGGEPGFKYPDWTLQYVRGDHGNQFKLDETR